MPPSNLLPDENIGSIIFHDAPLGIAIIDSVTGKIRETNKAFCAILGRDVDEVRGRRWQEFTHPDDLEVDERCIRTLVETQKGGVTREKRYVAPDGSERPVRITLALLPSADGRLRHLSMIESRGTDAALARERRARYLDVYRTQEAFFPAMAMLSEFRNRETGEHLLRTKAYVRLLLENLPGVQPFSRKAIALIANSALLHDVGKVGIPDSILLKTGRLTAEEFEVMKTHTTLGLKAITETKRLIRTDTTFAFAQEIAQSHHERWDGTGYPHRLREAEIPLSARVMAIADVYDALRSERPYKPAFGHEEAMATIRAESGSHLDPSLVKAFLALEKTVREIAAMETPRLERLGDEAGI